MANAMDRRSLVGVNPRRLTFWLLATAGVAVGHMAGYALAHPDAAAREAALGGHAYLPGTASLLIPAGVIAVLAWGVTSARSMGLAGQIRWTRLAAAQIAVFALQEVVERILTGQDASSVLSERGVWVGLVAQVVVAAVVTSAINLVRTVVRAVVIGSPRRSTVALWLDTPAVLDAILVPVRPAVAVGLRAPPVVGPS